MRKTLFERLGGMDEGFRLYYEDVDLCYRCRKAGYEVMVLPSVSLVHAHARQSAREPLGPLWRWHLRSAIRYFVKHRYVGRPRIAVADEVPDQGE
jgi:N-acetylglucosaminyl-diphospho-decaprenol L-rhamnosyltransferase